VLLGPGIVPYNRPDVSSPVSAILIRIVERCAPSALCSWYRDALTATAEEARLLAAYAGCGRRLRGLPVRFEPGERDSLVGAGLRSVAAWRLDRIARTGLVCEIAGRLAEPDATRVVGRLYRTGDNDERIALLGALPVLANAECYMHTAVDSCRTNVVAVFEAIACGNPYPVRYFDDHAFNQMVLKALFLGVPVRSIEGLDERGSHELARMAADYAAERRAAGRSVSTDIELVAALGSNPV